MTDAPEAPAIRADDADVMRLWRECGLPEYFLGNGGSNHKLVAFAKACSAPTEAQLQRVDAVLVAHCQAHGLSDISTWRLKHRVRKALTEG